MLSPSLSFSVEEVPESGGDKCVLLTREEMYLFQINPVIVQLLYTCEWTLSDCRYRSIDTYVPCVHCFIWTLKKYKWSKGHLLPCTMQMYEMVEYIFDLTRRGCPMSVVLLVILYCLPRISTILWFFILNFLNLRQWITHVYRKFSIFPYSYREFLFSYKNVRIVIFYRLYSKFLNIMFLPY